MLLSFRFHGLSDIGIVRSNNEDVWMAKPDLGFFALADGMGGHLAGEIAAKETIDHLLKIFSEKMRIYNEHPLFLPQTALQEKIMHAMYSSIESANERVYQMSKEKREYSGMGSTLCCLYWRPEMIVYAHVGDSRIYRYRNHKLHLLTKDHSLLTKWMAMGKKAEQCTTPYPYKHVITKAIGTHPKSYPEVAVSSYEPEDLFLLCSDGLTDVLSTQEIQAIIHQKPHLEEATEQLIQLSKFKGSSDNITVLMIQCIQ